MTTINELIELTKEKGNANFEFEGDKYFIHIEVPSIEQQSKWAAGEAAKNIEIMEYNNKIQKEIEIRHLKEKARIFSIENAPTQKPSDLQRFIPLTALERISESEIIYQWLIKDLS